MYARIALRTPGGERQVIDVKNKTDYELHDGYVKYLDDRGTWMIIPMHRVEHIEEYR